MFKRIVEQEISDWDNLDTTTINFLSKLLDKNPET